MKHVTLPTDYCVLHANLRSGGGSRGSSDGVERWEDPLVATSIGLEHSNTRNTIRSKSPCQNEQMGQQEQANANVCPPSL